MVALLVLAAIMIFVVTAPSHGAGTRLELPAQVSTPGKASEGIATVRIGRRVYEAEIAQTPADQARGLMFRKTLPPDRGMLFVFPDEIQRSFWMKNTLIHLDIIFITRDRKIDSFHTMSPCPGDPCPTYRSAGRAAYALEVNAGEVIRHRFRVGDTVTISMPPARGTR